MTGAAAARASLVVERFETFYLREYRGVVKLALALSHSRLVAEDIAQDAFLAAYRDWGRVGALDQPLAWVRKVAARRAKRTVYRLVLEARARTRLLRSQASGPVELAGDDQQVWQALRRLPKGQAQVIALHYLADCSVAEVAHTLGLAEGTVKAQLYRGRQTLAGQLRSGGEGELR